MYLLISNSEDPCVNLATEEYLLKNSGENVILLYRNQNCLVVGKHQNAMAEINYRFIHENNIPVIRRISGGGTVYHDAGNINFTFIRNGEEGNLVNFKAFIGPVAAFLVQKGIPAEIGPRNDILIQGLKVSGNAEHIFKKRTLHHGTLLFSSTLANLGNALKVEPEKYTDRAVKSVRSKVTNIRGYLEAEETADDFFASLARYFSGYYNSGVLTLDEEASSQIQLSAETKYKDWLWNFGYSPAYTFRNSLKNESLSLSIELQVEKGLIINANLEGNVDRSILTDLQLSLINQPHSFQALSSNSNIAKLENILATGSNEVLWSFF